MYIFYIFLFVSTTIVPIFGGEFSCQTTPYCDCDIGLNGQFLIECINPTNSHVIRVHSKPNEYVYIECHPDTSVSEYKLLYSLENPNVNLFRMTMCPLENETFKEIMTILGIEKVNILRFQSYDYNKLHNITKFQLNVDTVNRTEITYSDLKQLPIDLFANVPNLRWLDLRQNKIELVPGIFDPIPHLAYLELGQNNITDLTKGVFDRLFHLRFLKLRENRLKHLQQNLFDNLLRLEILDLSQNNLEDLPEKIFDFMENLKELYLQFNNIRSLPSKIFSPMLLMGTINLSNNSLDELPSQLFANLSHLVVVLIENSKVKSVPEDMFLDARKLQNVSLAYNDLKELPDQLFRTNTELKQIDLGYNLIKTFSGELFKNLKQLKILQLNDNHLTNITISMFGQLTSLQELDLENNRISQIHRLALKPLINLKKINLNNNLIKFNGMYVTPFSNLGNLERLYLARNQIETIPPDLRISLLKLKFLNLSFNRIKEIEFLSVQFLAPNITVDLRNNLIEHIDCDNADFMSRESGNLKYNKILISHNPISCDCFSYNLVRYFNGKMDPKVKNAIEFIPGNLTCAKPSNYAGKQVNHLRVEDFHCSYSYDASPCPNNCTCVLHPWSKSTLVNCSHSHRSRSPRHLPIVPNFSRVVLDLRGNSLESLSINFTNGSGYDRLSELYVSNNNLTQFEFESEPTKLEVLELHGNRLQEINATLLRNMLGLQKITLHDNPWMCNCKIEELLKYIQTEYKKVSFIQNIKCHGRETRSLVDLNHNDLCPVPLALIVLSIIFIISVFIAMALAIVYYRNKMTIKVWLYAHNLCLWFVTEADLDRDKKYDAFVSFSQKDETVVQEMIEKLEKSDPAFKLCIHYRDWIAGEWIPKQIAHSVEQSRRTVVILSPNFLKSDWAKMEFRSAHLNAMKEKRTRVIIVKYGDIGPIEKLDDELRAYLRMNTYIDWDDKLFWSRLRYALPHRQTENKKQKFLTQNIVNALQISLDGIDGKDHNKNNVIV